MKACLSSSFLYECNSSIILYNKATSGFYSKFIEQAYSSEYIIRGICINLTFTLPNLFLKGIPNNFGTCDNYVGCCVSIFNLFKNSFPSAPFSSSSLEKLKIVHLSHPIIVLVTFSKACVTFLTSGFAELQALK